MIFAEPCRENWKFTRQEEYSNIHAIPNGMAWACFYFLLGIPVPRGGMVVSSTLFCVYSTTEIGAYPNQQTYVVSRYE
ncbi:hypothetical protein SDC9_138572 [bioreactor metagenome]|uniref:Uncharacterized protein n=1 Tax=bioreactor metagenome TaxID=1076179 RepID=A0A645DRW6_9ZZZZ